MAKYIYVGSYSNEGAAGLLGGVDNRVTAVKSLCASVGAKMLSFELTRGQYDFCLTVQARSFDVVAAMLLKVRASGALEEGVLLEVVNINQIRKAGKGVQYKQPKEKVQSNKPKAKK